MAADSDRGGGGWSPNCLSPRSPVSYGPQVSPGPLQYHAGNVIITATLLTLLFNVNPLMRFDGYYMLSDFLEIPNLSTHGRQWLKGVSKRAFFGTSATPVMETGMRAFIVKAYGVLAMLWFVSIAIGLSIGASSLLEGFGLIIALIGIVLWVGIPLVKLFTYAIKGTKTETPNRVWFCQRLHDYRNVAARFF